jgi:uroporphyrin-III C-methyltransferase/precorrin-2 dehydrogenase/sirohydrochlorin ferrochelatase
MFITAQCKNSEENLNWPSIARQNQTLVVYMGLLKNEVLAEKLIKYGRSPDTAAAVIENGTTNSQRVIMGTLMTLSDLVKKHYIKSPALIIIGEVVSLAPALDWFSNNQLIQHNDDPNIFYDLEEAV